MIANRAPRPNWTAVEHQTLAQADGCGAKKVGASGSAERRDGDGPRPNRLARCAVGMLAQHEVLRSRSCPMTARTGRLSAAPPDGAVDAQPEGDADAKNARTLEKVAQLRSKRQRGKASPPAPDRS